MGNNASQAGSFLIDQFIIFSRALKTLLWMQSNIKISFGGVFKTLESYVSKFLIIAPQK